MAHNNAAHGIFVWQNTSQVHLIDGFTAYFNEKAGISHGAYTNIYQYRNLVLVENEVTIISHALSKLEEGADPQTWANLSTNGGTLEIGKHTLPADAPTRFIDCEFGLVLVDDAHKAPSVYDFVRCGLEPADFDLTAAHSDSIFRVQRADGTAYQLLGNGTVTTIPAFWTDPI